MLKKIFGYIFLLNALLFFYQGLTKNIFPPLLVPLKQQFAIDTSQAGLLVTAVFLGYALARFPSGLMVDWIGCHRTIVIGSAIMAAAFIFLGTAPNYLVLVLLTFLLGFASGIYVTAGYTLAVAIGSHKNAALSTAVFEMSGLTSGIIAPLLVTYFVLNYRWPYLFYLLGGTLLIVTGLFYFSEKSAKVSTKDSRGQLTALLLIFKDPRLNRLIIWSTLVGGLGAASWTGAATFIPVYLVESKGYAFDLANQMLALVAVAGLAAKIPIGFLADRFGTKRMMLIIYLMKTLLLGGFVAAQHYWQFIAILILLGVAGYNSNTLINAYVLRNIPEEHRGTGFGLFSTAYTVIYSLGPLLIGYLSVAFGLGGAILVGATGAASAVALIVFSSRQKTRAQPTAPL